MTIRSTFNLAGMMIALILLLAALSALAQSGSVDNLQFAVRTWTVQHLGGSTTYHKWELSWDSLLNQESAAVQFKGGGITDVWTTVNTSSAIWSPKVQRIVRPAEQQPRRQDLSSSASR